MHLEVTPAGAKYWRLKHRFNSKEKRLALGVYPEVSLADAREKRDKAHRLLAEGIDPGVHRKVQKATKAMQAENSFEALPRTNKREIGEVHAVTDVLVGKDLR